VEREAGSAEQSVARWTEAVNLARVHEASAFEGICLRGLGEALLEQQLLARALPVLRRSVHVLESAGAERRDSFQLANSRRALAEAYLIDGKPVQAEEEVRQGLELLEKGGLEMHPQAAALFDTLAEALAAQAKLGPALDSLGKAEAIILAHFGRGSAMALTTAAKRGVLEERAGQAEAAVRDLAESLRRMENAGSDLDRTRVRLMRYYAAALEATHRKKQAKAVRAEIRTLSVE
jgi:tetratricopeptide (TPR) repeat protein